MLLNIPIKVASIKRLCGGDGNENLAVPSFDRRTGASYSDVKIRLK